MTLHGGKTISVVHARKKSDLKCARRKNEIIITYMLCSMQCILHKEFKKRKSMVQKSVKTYKKDETIVPEWFNKKIEKEKNL